MDIIAWLDAVDKKMFLFLNSLNSCFWDNIMWQISGKYIWIPLYIIILFFIIRERKWNAIATIVLLIIMIVISDQVSGLIKDSVMRFRPSHNPGFNNIVHLVTNPKSGDLYRGGNFGFVSSHAANSFALAVFVTLFFRKRWIGISIFVWAFIVSYSRIYLGVHYPFDILGGALVGLGAGIFIFYMDRRIQMFKIFKTK